MRFDFAHLWKRGRAPVFRPARKAERSVVERLGRSQKRVWLEATPRPEHAGEHVLEHVGEHVLEHVGEACAGLLLEHYLDHDGQLVGIARAARAALDHPPRPWWLASGAPELAPAAAGESLVGLEAVVFGGDEAAVARAAALLSTLRRAQVLEAGLRRWVCCAPLAGYAPWRERFGPEGYVQQVEAGAIFDPSLSPRLEAGARVIAVVDAAGAPEAPSAALPAPEAWGDGAARAGAWLAWESPVR